MYGVFSHPESCKDDASQVQQNSEEIYSGYQAPTVRLDPKTTRHAEGLSILGLDVLEHIHTAPNNVFLQPSKVFFFRADSSALQQGTRCGN